MPKAAWNRAGSSPAAVGGLVVGGLPVISYRDYTDSGLKVAHCSNRFCAHYHGPR